LRKGHRLTPHIPRTGGSQPQPVARSREAGMFDDHARDEWEKENGAGPPGWVRALVVVLVVAFVVYVWSHP
jgi:hypothetical protein